MDEETSQLQVKDSAIGIHKQDIDDNCPMTGDETDTENNTYFVDNVINPGTLSDVGENVGKIDHPVVKTFDEVDLENTTTLSRKMLGDEISETKVDDQFPTVAVDDEESLSSDLNYFSDEDNSSIAGSFDDLGRDDEDSLSEPMSEKTREEKLRRLALRRHLDQLGELVVEKECEVQQARDELNKCRVHLEELETEINNVSEQIQTAEETKQMATYYRLRSNYEKLLGEVEIERSVEIAASQKLEDAEFYLAQTYIEHAKFLPLDEELEADENNTEQMKAEKASSRIKKELNTALVFERRKKNREKEHLSAVRERERKNRQTLMSTKKNREVAMKYLKETMSRVRQRESEEEDKSRHDLNERMSALLGLKRNIEVNKENIRAVQARDQHIKKKELIRDHQERQSLIAMGENPDEVMTRKKRIRQFERDKEAFERKQREREIEIVNKVISEEKQMKRRYQQQPQLWPDNRPRRVPRKRSKPRFALSSGSESMEYGADVEDTGGKISYLSKVSTDEEGEFSPYGATNRDDDERDTTEDDDKKSDEEKIKNANVVEELNEEDEEDDETLVQPEFKGLWEQKESQDQKSSSNWKSFNYTYSNYEQEMMKSALQKQKKNIVQKQVAAGKEFKGASFYSKPEIIIFKDFDVGKTYKKKVLLTNVSYTQNFCQYVGITDRLNDFIDIQFSPPGAMSAGLTCDLNVTFKPMINEDLNGQIEMMAQTGLFYIPIKCLVKRCEVSSDMKEIDFENVVVGEMKKKILTIKNEGALGAIYTFSKKLQNVSPVKSPIKSPTSPLKSPVKSTTSYSTNNLSESNYDEEESYVDSIPSGIEDIPLSTKQSIPDDIMRVGKISSGLIDPFSSVQLDLIFAPHIPQEVETLFRISFDDNSQLKPIDIIAKGVAIDVPVWVERETVDLQICMYDRLYQDSIVLHNRATSALRLRFEVPKEVRDHLEMLPKTAYIQAESKFSAQLKFLPRQTLMSDAGQYIDKENSVLNVPITIRVADQHLFLVARHISGVPQKENVLSKDIGVKIQTQAVIFNVSTTVTSSDLEFETNEINFGCCTVYESVYHTIKLLNKSVLPQQYGFVGTPEGIDVQPNDGFGTILPNESLDIDIAFQPSKAQEYKLNLICKSHIGREFPLRCRATGVLPPLKLSESLIKFCATSLYDTSSTHLFIINDHKSSNEFTHPVPRIGSGDIFPVGPTSFQFIIPNGSPITISPIIGTVLPGQKTLLHVSFSPKLEPSVITKKAKELSEDETRTDKSKLNIEEKQDEPKSKGSKAGRGKSTKSITSQSTRTQSPDVKPTNSNHFSKKAQIKLMQTYTKSFSSYKIPCCIAYGECGDPGTLEYNKNYTLYLEVHCPTVRPSLIVVSENGDNLVDFGKVSMGQRHTQIISIQNISNTVQELTSSPLDPHGSFELVNSLRPIEPGCLHSLIIAFTPHDHNEFLEILELYSPAQTISVRLKGQGIRPKLKVEPPEELFDAGDALVLDTVISPLKEKGTSQDVDVKNQLTNISELSIEYDVEFGSLLSSKHNRTQNMPTYLKQFKERPTTRIFEVGPGNKSGLCVFGCNPPRGKLEPGESVELQVSFSPDHPSELYRDELFFTINGAEEFFQRHLVGRCWPSLAYTRGWDRLTPAEENLANLNHINENDEVVAESAKNVFLTFHSKSLKSKFQPAERTIEVGCIRSNIQTKKSLDFCFENMKEANEKGFTVDTMKGGIDIGIKKNVTIKWTPPANYDPQDLMKTQMMLIIRGDGTTTYKITLRGYVVSHMKKDE